MMEAVTLSLGAWLRRCVPDADLSFDDPARERADADGPVVVRICLYDVREESRGRGGGMYLRDGADRPVSARMQPLRVLRYSYRLTAHGGDWQARQRVLGDVVVAGAATPCLPDDLVHASLSAFGAGALPLLVAPAEPVPAPPSPPPPSPPLHLVVLAPLRPPADHAVDRAPSRIDLGAHRTDTPDAAGAPGASGTSATGSGRRRSVPAQRPRIEERAR
ncbi:Pvc16 family protein [Streptomyces massasporeus]|uniref:Pvc16 family protein n=1 Tax=Streptomyces massasporeus TaxID=67324 RepID=UPI003451997B